MARQMRIETLKSAVEAAGVAMAPAPDQFDGDPAASGGGPRAPEMDAGNYSRSWASPNFRSGFDKPAARPNKLKSWFSGRWMRPAST